MRIQLAVERFVPVQRAEAHLYYDLARHLVARGHQVQVVTKLPSGYLSPEDKGRTTALPIREFLDGIEILRVRGLSWLHSCCPALCFEAKGPESGCRHLRHNGSVIDKTKSGFCGSEFAVRTRALES